MPFASSISPERRARLRRLRAEFEVAFDLVGDRGDRSSATYRAADACYRAWIAALDGVAMALLDDIDACEAAGVVAEPSQQAAVIPTPVTADLIGLDLLLRGTEDIPNAADLIGAGPAVPGDLRRPTPKSRAMSVIGADRVARHWIISLGVDRQVGLADHTR